MKIAYWNIHNSKYTSIKKHMLDFLLINSLDLLFISEYKNIEMDKLKKDLKKKKYELLDGVICDKVLLIKKSDSDFIIPTDDKRFIVSQSSFYRINIVGLHLEDQHSSDDFTRNDTICRICESLVSLKNKCENTILIGDFNCLPTDEILLNKDSICCIPFKDEVRRQKYNYIYYNPTLLALNEEEQLYGSLRYISTRRSLIWYLYDQVMISKTLIDKKYILKYLKDINGRSLVTKNNIPDIKISDHLPLFFEIEL